MIRNPVTLLVLALAMLLAPMGVCVAKGHAQVAIATAHDGAGVHGGTPSDPGNSGHANKAKHHFCSDWQPPDYLTASQTGADLGPVIVPATLAMIPHAGRSPAARDSALLHSWYGRALPIPPPLPSAAKVRLQI